ncbi:alpha/beta fold hydrolase [Chitinophaga vietnamensis]|uniref:alpha/beta fold hydrolase n=1 Tax=Chitinophaga vietnamensis TaxID=2593957 RepID=UPI00117899C2|nr:alpha/beta hydrolase [Chitinophaga vietnamensis]
MIQHINKHHSECLVFFNPLCSDNCFWKKNIPEELVERFEVILFDYPGYHSPFVKLNNFSEVAGYVRRELLGKINKPMHLIGYSYGGLLIQHLLRDTYDNLASVILVACANKLAARDKEILSVLKGLAENDLYLFCRALTLFSHKPAEVNNNPLMGLQKFSNLKLSVTDSQAIVQQINHILQLSSIQLPKQTTNTLLIYGEEDRLIDTTTISQFRSYFENFSMVEMPGESHIVDQDQLFHHVTEFLKLQS